MATQDDTVVIGQSWQAVYHNISVRRYLGFGVISGVGVSAGSNGVSVTVGSGTILYAGDRVDVSGVTDLSLPAAQSNPRKDLIVHDGTGIDVVKGTAAPVPTEQSSAERFEYYQPAPPAGIGDDYVVLAEVFVPANASSLSNADVNNLHVEPALATDSVSLPDGRPILLGDDDDTRVEYVPGVGLEVTDADGNQWTFGTDGDTILPGSLTFDGTITGGIDVDGPIDLPDDTAVRFGDQDDATIRYDRSAGAFVVDQGQDGATFLPSGTLELDGEIRTTGDADIGGDIQFGGTFDPTDVSADNVDADVSLSIPRYADNNNAVQAEREIWFNDGTGPDAAGIYYFDGGVVGPLEAGSGSSPGSLSGLTIDTTKDFGGFSLTGLGHDEVDVPQTRELTVADFGGGTLPQDAVGATSQATVQSSVVLEGSYSLQADTVLDSDEFIQIGFSNRAANVQFGDEFEYYAYLTDNDDKHNVALSVTDPSRFYFSNGQNAYRLRVAANSDKFGIREFIDGNTQLQTNVTAPVSSHLNEVLRIEGTVDDDGNVVATLYDSNDNELATVSDQLTSDTHDGNPPQFLAQNQVSSSTMYFDGPFVERRVGEYYSETQNGVTQLGNDVQPSGAIETGPQEAVVTDSTVHGILRSDDALSAGDEIEVVEWDAGVGRRTLKGIADGNGGVYGLRSPLAERVTQNLTWEVETFVDLQYWSAAASDSGYTTELTTARPRQLSVTSTGDTDSNDFGGAQSSVLTTVQSLDAFRIVFHDVTYTANAPTGNAGRLAISTVSSPDTNVVTNADALGVELRDGVVAFKTVNGSPSTQAGPSQTDGQDYVIEYDGAQASFAVNGSVFHTTSFSKNGDFRPTVQVFDDNGTSTAETLSIGEITVEEL